MVATAVRCRFCAELIPFSNEVDRYHAVRNHVERYHAAALAKIETWARRMTPDAEAQPRLDLIPAGVGATHDAWRPPAE